MKGDDYMTEEINHKEYKDRILDALNKYRGQRSPAAHTLYKDLYNSDMKKPQIIAYLNELINERMVKRNVGQYHTLDIPIPQKPGKTIKKRTKEEDTYYILDAGVKYIENGYKIPEHRSEIAEKLDITNELLGKILENTDISIDEQKKQTELLSELKVALYDKNDAKARKVLIEALGFGKMVAAPLLVEYLKNILYN